MGAALSPADKVPDGFIAISLDALDQLFPFPPLLRRKIRIVTLVQVTIVQEFLSVHDGALRGRYLTIDNHSQEKKIKSPPLGRTNEITVWFSSY